MYSSVDSCDAIITLVISRIRRVNVRTNDACSMQTVAINPVASCLRLVSFLGLIQYIRRETFSCSHVQPTAPQIRASSRWFLHGIEEPIAFTRSSGNWNNFIIISVLQNNCQGGPGKRPFLSPSQVPTVLVPVNNELLPGCYRFSEPSTDRCESGIDRLLILIRRI